MISLRGFIVTPEEHRARQEAHLRAGEKFRESIKDLGPVDVDDINHMRSLAERCQEEYFPLASNPVVKDIPFGPVGTLETSGCVVFVTAQLMKMYDFADGDVDINEWTKEVVEKGYRSWRFSKYPKVSFVDPAVDIGKIKTRFAGIAPVEDCKTCEELVSVLGKIEGIGGSMFLIDNVIFALAFSKSTYKRVNMEAMLDATRISDVQDLFKNLDAGLCVPIRVNNAVYHDDPNRKGGHYIILAGLSEGDFIVYDSSIGFTKVNIWRVLEAATADENLIAVWNIWWI